LWTSMTNRMVCSLAGGETTVISGNHQQTRGAAAYPASAKSPRLSLVGVGSAALR